MFVVLAFIVGWALRIRPCEAAIALPAIALIAIFALLVGRVRRVRSGRTEALAGA